MAGFTQEQMVQRVRNLLGNQVPSDLPTEDIVTALNDVHREKIPEDTPEGYEYRWQDVTLEAGVIRYDLDELYCQEKLPFQFQTVDPVISVDGRRIANYTDPQDFYVATLRRRGPIDRYPSYVLIEGLVLTFYETPNQAHVMEVPGYTYPAEFPDEGVACASTPRALASIYGAAEQIAAEFNLDHVINYAHALYQREIQRVSARRLSQRRKVLRRASF